MRLLQNIVIYLSFLCFIGIILSGCEGNTHVRGSLDAAESLMEDAPDSSYAILSRIDSARLDGDRENARYALLLSMALDKIRIDTTDFSILQPALDYYPEHGTPDEKLRTFYYQGRIFQNRGDDDNAMKSFVKALDYKDNTTDTLTLARCLVAQGSLYYSAYEYKEFVKNSLKAAELFAYKKRVSSQFINLKNALLGSVQINDTISSDSIFNLCEALMQTYDYGREIIKPEAITYFSSMRPKEELKQYISQFIPIPMK